VKLYSNYSWRAHGQLYLHWWRRNVFYVKWESSLNSTETNCRRRIDNTFLQCYGLCAVLRTMWHVKDHVAY